MTEPPAPPLYYPVSLNVSGHSCLVVGGGKVAARKARSLLDCGATVTVIAAAVSDDMEALVVTATGIPEVDGTVYADAETAGVWANSADDPAHCSFILPAVHRDGAVTVSVSTGGLSPALASWLRTRLAADAGEGLGVLAQLLGEARASLKQAGLSSESVDWTPLLDGPLLELIRAGDIDNARAKVRAAAGL
jgi:siroheme synthase-like protein